MNDDTKSAWVVIVVGLLVFATISAVVKEGCSSHTSTAPLPPEPTEYERNVNSTKALLRHQHPEASKEEIDRAARRIADEWERAKRNP